MPEVEPTCNPRLTKEDLLGNGYNLVACCPSDDCEAKVLKHPSAGVFGPGYFSAFFFFLLVVVVCGSLVLCACVDVSTPFDH